MKFLAGFPLIAANSLFLNQEMPEARRFEILKGFFTPEAGQESSVSPRELSHSKSLKDIYTLRGFITVSPPRGSCFTITTNPRRPDHRVCKKTAVSYQLADIGPTGRIEWKISTGPSDFGTTLWWQTPYLAGKFVDFSMPWPGASQALFVSRCKPLQKSDSEKSLELTIFPAKNIILKIPSKETLAPQPEREKPNLYIQQSTFASGFVRVDAANEASDIDPNTIVSNWQIHPRDSYTLSGRLVLTGDSGSGRGECRYRYSGYEYHPEYSVLECRNLGTFQWLYLPLSCLKKSPTP